MRAAPGLGSKTYQNSSFTCYAVSTRGRMGSDWTDLDIHVLDALDGDPLLALVALALDDLGLFLLCWMGPRCDPVIDRWRKRQGGDSGDACA